MIESTTGRRERKKAQTRAAISEVAVRLFQERGYDHVGIREIAEAADVAVATVFKHFPGKEALVFDEDADREAELVAAVRDRGPGRSVLDALREHLLAVPAVTAGHDTEMTAFVALVDATPELREYARRMWLRHETALAAAITATTDATEDDIGPRALAHFVLQAPGLAHARPDPRRAIVEIFALLDAGWGDFGREGA